MARPKPKRPQTSRIERADRKVARTTGGERNTPWIKAIGQLSELADQPPLIAASAATIVVGLGSAGFGAPGCGKRA